MNAKNVIYRGNEVDLKIGGEWFGYDVGASPLGEGAMGTVYLGRSFLTGQTVAIKRVHDKYANIPSIRKRAKLEASLEFRHPNLVEMIGYCEEQPNKGPIFIVSRLVHGVTLDQYVKNSLNSCPKEIRVQKVCELIYRVLDALDFIHSRNVIHMDIKPSNIMLENGSNVRLMDLGIAFAGDDMDITSAGLVGTPKYAAPEQVLEAGQKIFHVDKTADFYELGVTLYELLTGTNPFDAPTMEDTLELQRTKLLPESPDIPDALMDVLLRATDKYPQNRFQSALDFKRAIQQSFMVKEKKNNWLLPLCIGGIAGVILILILMLLL